MKTVKNEKGFKVIGMSLLEVSEIFGGLGICDSCNDCSRDGYYIAVLNSWYCPECYEQWIKRAKRYKEDIPIEERNYEKLKKLM